MPHASAADVRDAVKTRIGRLAERAEDPTLMPSSADHDALDALLKDALTEIAKQTGRLETTTTPNTTAFQGYVELPPHIDVIEEAEIWEGGTAYDLGVQNGAEVARLAQSTDAEEGRPKYIGSHAGKLWLYPVPDDAPALNTYEMALTCKMNGAVSTNPQPNNDLIPPGLDALVDLTPADFDRALVAYVTSEWLADSGEVELAQRERARFGRDVQKYDTDPQRKTTQERPYNPLGI